MKGDSRGLHKVTLEENKGMERTTQDKIGNPAMLREGRGREEVNGETSWPLEVSSARP